MKWDRVALIVLAEGEGDVSVQIDTEYFIRRYNIPPHLVVRINQPIQQFMFNRNGLTMAGELAAMSGVFAGKLTGQSKIIITGHGDEPPHVSCSDLGAVLMSRLFKVLGVSDVGLISFKSCYTGQSTYLEDLTAACKREGIRFGWCLAYINWSGIATDLYCKKFYSRRQVVGFPDLLTYLISCGFAKLPDSFRVRVVKGSLELPPEFVKTLGPRFNSGITTPGHAASYSEDVSDIFDI
ncbi:hypothetical protein [Enterobacter mori]|uniref:hypothetical protein n=1 Tax=Enterobacter mori TaxID=539813 RepID=UPI003B844388